MGVYDEAYLIKEIEEIDIPIDGIVHYSELSHTNPLPEKVEDWQRMIPVGHVMHVEHLEPIEMSKSNNDIKEKMFNDWLGTYVKGCGPTLAQREQKIQDINKEVGRYRMVYLYLTADVDNKSVIGEVIENLKVDLANTRCRLQHTERSNDRLNEQLQKLKHRSWWQRLFNIGV